MQEEPGKEGQEQNRYNACGQIILLRGQYVVNTINAGQRAEDGEDKVDWLFHRLLYSMFPRYPTSIIDMSIPLISDDASFAVKIFVQTVSKR